MEFRLVLFRSNYDEKGQLLIQLSFHPNSLTITITDQGRGFNFNSYKKPDLKERIKNKKRGGMGIYLIRNLMDEVSDRKSTRLNSSHVAISYAVFCLNK